LSLDIPIASRSFPSIPRRVLHRGEIWIEVFLLSVSSVRVQDAPDDLGLAGKDLTPGKMIEELEQEEPDKK
jgi:hypothetical protein